MCLKLRKECVYQGREIHILPNTQDNAYNKSKNSSCWESWHQKWYHSMQYLIDNEHMVFINNCITTHSGEPILVCETNPGDWVDPERNLTQWSSIVRIGWLFWGKACVPIFILKGPQTKRKQGYFRLNAANKLAYSNHT